MGRIIRSGVLGGLAGLFIYGGALLDKTGDEKLERDEQKSGMSEKEIMESAVDISEFYLKAAGSYALGTGLAFAAYATARRREED